MAVTGMQTSDWRSDGSLAYALFRLTFGLNIMMRGIVRIALGLPAFQNYMLTQFKDVPVMPPGFLVPFASALPFIETLIGLCLLVGFQTRAALIAGTARTRGESSWTSFRTPPAPPLRHSVWRARNARSSVRSRACLRPRNTPPGRRGSPTP